MLAATIDAGSNTLRLLIGKVVDGRVSHAHYHRRICRLAGNFSPRTGLSAEARERALCTFREFADLCRRDHVQRIRAVGTAAFRQAVNGEDFAFQVRQTTGLPVEIISGKAEAFYTAKGVISAIDPVPAHTLIFDIGGGSTEFILCLDGKLTWSRTFPLGVVHLIEGRASSVGRQEEISKALALLHEELEHVCHSMDVNLASLKLVGTAGTVTTLAALDMQMTDYDRTLVNNHCMPYQSVLEWYERLCPMTPREREALPGMEAGRGDLIIAGLEIILGLLRTLQADLLVASDFGILEGLMLALHDEMSSLSLR
jgi:exopolyphosphatase/guanosine-5'-triphosphate,3'-diphosphate pyrophosphatase